MNKLPSRYFGGLLFGIVLLHLAIRGAVKNGWFCDWISPAEDLLVLPSLLVGTFSLLAAAGLARRGSRMPFLLVAVLGIVTFGYFSAHLGGLVTTGYLPGMSWTDSSFRCWQSPVPPWGMFW